MLFRGYKHPQDDISVATKTNCQTMDLFMALFSILRELVISELQSFAVWKHFSAIYNQIQFVAQNLPTIDTKLARACGVPVGRRSDGRLATTLVATINVIIFFPFFLCRDLFSQKECSDWKTCFAKIVWSAQNPSGKTFPGTVGHFGAPWRPFWNFQAVRHCRRWASAPGATRLVLLLLKLQTLAGLVALFSRSGLLVNTLPIFAWDFFLSKVRKCT